MENSKTNINSSIYSVSPSKNTIPNDQIIEKLQENKIVGNNLIQSSVVNYSKKLGIKREIFSIKTEQINEIDDKSYFIGNKIRSYNLGNHRDVSSIKMEDINAFASLAIGDEKLNNFGNNRFNSSIKNEEINDGEGQNNSSSPSAELAAHLRKRAKALENLQNIEQQIYDMETSYLHDRSQCGNVLKGFEGFLSSSKNTTAFKRSRKLQPEDRLFSLSSVTSPALEEQAKEEGLTANEQGKPRKGRGGLRETRKPRQSSDADYDYEDDPEFLE